MTNFRGGKKKKFSFSGVTRYFNRSEVNVQVDLHAERPGELFVRHLLLISSRGDLILFRNLFRNFFVTRLRRRWSRARRPRASGFRKLRRDILTEFYIIRANNGERASESPIFSRVAISAVKDMWFVVS